MSQVLAYTATATALIPAGISAVAMSKLPRSYKLIALYFMISLLLEIIGTILALNVMNNLPFFHLDTVLQVILFTLFYRGIIINKTLKTMLIMLPVLFAVFAAFNAIFNEGIFEFNSLARVVGSLLLVLCSLVLFWRMFNEDQTSYLDQKPQFWINCGVLIYFSGSLIIFSLYNYLIHVDIPLSRDAWKIHSVLLILFNTLCAFGLWKAARKPI